MIVLIEWLLSFLAKTGLDFWSKRGLAPVVVEAQELGVANANLNTAQAAVKTETAIATAEANAPTTKAQVVDELNKGQF